METGCSLQFNNSSGMQVMEPPGEGLLQNGVLLTSRAMAGEVPGGEGGKLVQGIAQLPTLGIHADKVEAAEEHIGAEPMEDVQHALVGAAAEAVFLPGFLHQQVLLVEIGVIGVDTVFPDGLAEDTEGEGPQQVIAGAEGEALGNFQHIGHRDQPGIALQGRVQADVFAAAEIFPEGIAA